MIAYNNCFFEGENSKKKKVLSEFIEGFLSEIFPLKEQNWEKYIEIRNNYLRNLCSSNVEYEQACRCLADRLNLVA